MQPSATAVNHCVKPTTSFLAEILWSSLLLTGQLWPTHTIYIFLHTEQTWGTALQSFPQVAAFLFLIPPFQGNDTTIKISWIFVLGLKKNAPGQRTAYVGSDLWDAAHLHWPSWAGRGTQQQLLTLTLLPTARDVQPKQGKSLSNAMKMLVQALEIMKMFLKVDCPILTY